MPTPQEELLKQPEQKADAKNEETVFSPISIDSSRIEVLIKLRQEKLAAIKPFISLKLHGQITVKLEEEAGRLREQLQEKKIEIAKQNRDQSLPKAFFEQRYMKIKTIRID